MFDNIADLVYEKLYDKTGFDQDSRMRIKDLVDSSVAFVVSQLSKNSSTEEDLKEKIETVADNVIAFIAVVIAQFEFFGRGENDGPFFDMIRTYHENRHDSGSTPTQ